MWCFSGLGPLDNITNHPKAAIAHAKTLLKSEIVFPAGKPYAVRILNYDSILVWTGTIHDA